jgi:hypothetical protein
MQMTKSIFETIIVDPKFAKPAIEYAHSKEMVEKRLDSQKEWQNMPKVKVATKDDLDNLMKHFTKKAS